MTIATFAIAGFPPFAGFFSKDEILGAVFHSPYGGPVLWARRRYHGRAYFFLHVPPMVHDVLWRVQA